MGSSPLTRGKLEREDGGMSVQGLIPAHAGKTSGEAISVSGRWAHPRSRGENSLAGILSRPPTGSSPLTRGKLRPFWGCELDRGLIPAHAGKTSSRIA